MQAGLTELVEAWRSVEGRAPYILPGDQSVLAAKEGLTVLHNSFAEYCADPRFGLDDTRLHTGLVPIPYMGSLAHAKIFLLMLNPGLHPVDYFSEERFSDYRNRLIDNLHQRKVSSFPFLDPELCWHSGGQYWLGKFHDLALSLSASAGSFTAALDVLARNVACLELVPYHSPRFGIRDALIGQLASVKLIQRFVREDLRPRALRGEILLIVTRQTARWGLEPSANVVLYNNSQAHGGHISSATPGGGAILRFLNSNAMN